jgi:hypothetical protein
MILLEIYDSIRRIIIYVSKDFYSNQFNGMRLRKSSVGIENLRTKK